MGPGYEEYDLTKVRLVLCPLHPVPVVRHRRSTTTSQLKACSHAATDLNGTCSEHLRNCELPVDSFRFGCLQISARCLHLIVPSNNESHQLLGKTGHIFTLPRCSYNLYLKKNYFVSRCLLKFVQLSVFLCFTLCAVFHLYQFLCNAHVWWVIAKIYLLTYLIQFSGITAM